MTYPMIDPVIFEIGPLQVRWYGLMYIIGFACAYLILLYLSRRRVFRIDRNEIEDLLVYGIIGLLLGARVGYCLFYNLEFYLANPLKILAVWEGGLSFHGGLIGLVIAGAVFARIRKKSFLMLVDMGAVAATPGLFFGRIGNFINGELYGRVTDVPWGMVFPGAGPYPRHPSQLYEALLEGLVLFAVLFFLSLKVRLRGVLIAVFLMGYGLARFFVEFFREPDAHIGFVAAALTMGQVLSLFMAAAGAAVFVVLVMQRTSVE
ncbi:MAG: prolipoprotein diacylglyceryl transferase [Thermodesulfobacteriota bacterium]